MENLKDHIKSYWTRRAPSFLQQRLREFESEKRGLWLAEIVDLLSRLIRGRGMACLFICHDIALAQSFCDRLLVMHRGKIVEEGTPDEIVQSPKQEYTKLLIDSVL